MHIRCTAVGAWPQCGCTAAQTYTICVSFWQDKTKQEVAAVFEVEKKRFDELAKTLEAPSHPEVRFATLELKR